MDIYLYLHTEHICLYVLCCDAACDPGLVCPVVRFWPSPGTLTLVHTHIDTYVSTYVYINLKRILPRPGSGLGIAFWNRSSIGLSCHGRKKV